MTPCPSCGRAGKIVNECRCDPDNLPTPLPPNPIRFTSRYNLADLVLALERVLDDDFGPTEAAVVDDLLRGLATGTQSSTAPPPALVRAATEEDDTPTLTES